ncbi:hypothetical protein Hdeb2414_s0021g00577841 [Helianthus debilis subsp. tardiflorus]
MSIFFKQLRSSRLATSCCTFYRDKTLGHHSTTRIEHYHPSTSTGHKQLEWLTTTAKHWSNTTKHVGGPNYQQQGAVWTNNGGNNLKWI